MIDYKILAQALTKYEEIGYTNVDLPWFVWPYVNNITCPRNVLPCVFKDKVFVGSAEQSFLQLALDKKKILLRNIKYCGITPCVRDETVSTLHENGFMKLELFVLTDHFGFLEQMTSEVMSVFNELSGKSVDLVQTDEYSYDININGIEMGSYSMRTHEDLTWVCGTGLALPRFNHALK